MVQKTSAKTACRTTTHMKGLLERSGVIEIIDSESEFEDVKYFRDDVVNTIRNEFRLGGVESEHLADLLITSVVTAAKETKQSIRDRVLAAPAVLAL